MNNIKKITKDSVYNIVLWLGVMVISIVLGLTLLTVSFSLDFPQEKRDAVMSALRLQGWYPRATVQKDAYGENFSTFYPDVLDYGSDEIILIYSTYNPEKNAFDQSVRAPILGAFNYFRYWHGYAVFLRPLLRVFDLSALKILNSWIQIVLIVYLSILLYKKSNNWINCFVPVFFYMLYLPMAASGAFQYMPVFYLSVLGSILILFIKKDEGTIRFDYLLFLSLGILTAFFDLLTAPLLTWAIPAVFMLLHLREDKKEIYYVRKIILSAISWTAGYFVFWFSKFVISYIYLGSEATDIFTEKIYVRAGGGYDFIDRIRALYCNWKVYSFSAHALCIGILFLLWIIVLYSGKLASSPKRFGFFLIVLSSPIWYFVLSEHTTAHHFFTYRIYLAALVALLAMLSDSLSVSKSGNSVREKRKISVITVVFNTLVIIFGILAGIGSLHMPLDELDVNNYSLYGGEEYIVKNDTIIRQLFVPKYNRIEGVNLVLLSNDTEGEYRVILKDNNENELYVKTVPAQDFKDSNILLTELKWIVKANKPYWLEIQLVNFSETAKCWITEEDVEMVANVSDLSIDGEEINGCTLIGWQFGTMIAEKKYKAFAIASVTMFIIVMYYVFIYQFLDTRKKENVENGKE